MIEYNVSEIFTTIQGEGILVGTPAAFIRLFGCPIHCPWCDTRYTWDSNGLEDYIKMTASEICNAIDGCVPLAVITGGEPTIYNLDELIVELHGRKYTVALETSGLTWKGKILPDFITVSPKREIGFKVHPTLLENADEIKFVVDNRLSYDDVDKFLSNRNSRTTFVFMPEGAPPSPGSVVDTMDMVRAFVSNYRKHDIRYGDRLQWRIGVK